MRRFAARTAPPISRLLPVLIATLTCALLLVASDRDWHEALHAPGDGPHPECAACLLAHGLIEPADTTPPLTVVAGDILWPAKHPPTVLPVPPDRLLAPTRGPPVA